VLVLIYAWAAWAQTQPRQQPKLVLLVVIDQFRYDYLTRFRDQYSGGFDKLLTSGAVFENANLDHYPTVTAIGHATTLSGATPALSGIIGNDWYDREEQKRVLSTSDDTVKLIGETGSGASPRRLLVSTIGDQLKIAHPGTSHVMGISLKDRSAILPVGHMADGAFWYDTKNGTFISSTYYFAELPEWVKSFNSRHPSDNFAGAEWAIAGPPMKSNHLPSAAGPGLYNAIFESPFGNELLESLAEAAIAGERLGEHDSTDLLSVSFSSNDAVGHAFGPDSAEVHDISIRTDQVLGKLFSYLDRRIGMRNVLVILTADHGVAPVPEDLAKWKMPGGRMSSADLFDPIKSALEAKFGKGPWILYTAGTSPYLNLDLIRAKGLDAAEVRRVAAKAAAAVPHVAHVYTRDELESGEVQHDPISNKVARSFNSERSGDLEILLEPYWIRGAEGTTHGTPYAYDTHIPLIFMGPGIKPGNYPENVTLNDLAPTLATTLRIQTPSGSVGRVLGEIIRASGGQGLAQAKNPNCTRPGASR
jgi:predicted AlkP superfamily pyrophosphatase or phosphodiesterase